MRLFIEPNDILMFRDGRPFAGGDDHFARVIFPPSPATFYGALRSHILSHSWSEFDKYKSEPGQIPENIRSEIGTPEELGTLTLRQFTLARRNSSGVTQFFPMPMDVVKEKGNEEKRTYLLKPSKLSGGRMTTDLSHGLNNPWIHSENPMEAVSGFLSTDETRRYLIGEAPSGETEPEKLFEREERTGIRKNRDKRSVETGGLYSVEYVRLNEDTGFAIEVENTKLLPESGMLRLGGDNRSARYSTGSWAEIPVEPIKKKIAETKRFKIILTTPAVFNKGWLPGCINSDTMRGQIEEITVRLISACIGKPIAIGGYDFVKNMPKVMKKAVSAGSVYYFELVDGSVDALFERLWLQSISDERAQEGFGITLIGGFDYV